MKLVLIHNIQDPVFIFLDQSVNIFEFDFQYLVDECLPLQHPRHNLKAIYCAHCIQNHIFALTVWCLVHFSIEYSMINLFCMRKCRNTHVYEQSSTRQMQFCWVAVVLNLLMLAEHFQNPDIFKGKLLMNNKFSLSLYGSTWLC